MAKKDVLRPLLTGLERLEYRGYDSAGVALITNQNQLVCTRRAGKLINLLTALHTHPLQGDIGIAHTRWATHGIPSERNAHPHISDDKIAVVHNGVIENYEELAQELRKNGYTFNSDTDTEVIVHYIHWMIAQSYDLLQAMQLTVKRLKGSFAIAMIHRDFPDQIIAARYNSPLVIGIGIEQHGIASDIWALLPMTQHFYYLEEGDIVTITVDGFTIHDLIHKKAKNPICYSHHPISYSSTSLGDYAYYMHKEIHEQSYAIRATLDQNLSQPEANHFPGFKSEHFKQVTSMHIVACGSSYHAGLAAKYWLESLAQVSCQVDVASEYRYRDTIVLDNTIFLAISQSGETADTLAAVSKSKAYPYSGYLGICNVASSTLVRALDAVFMTQAGPEVGVASTKAFTTQLVVLLCLARRIALAKNTLEDDVQILQALQELPALIEQALNLEPLIQKIAALVTHKNYAFFIARGILYPIALEGALKLKEISYMQAQAYPGGELKHGPLALIDDAMITIALAPSDGLLDKMKSNLQEIQARKGQLIIFTDIQANFSIKPEVTIVYLPRILPILTPILYTIPLQFLSYYVALDKNLDIDKPRNLAKSVTVE